MGLSREARIGIWAGIAVAIALILIEPKQSGWRIVLLIVLAGCMVFVAKELNWVNQRTLSLSIVQGETQSHQLSMIRLGFAIFVAISSVTVFGVITWPAKESEASASNHAVLLPVSPDISAGNHSATPKGIRPGNTASMPTMNEGLKNPASKPEDLEKQKRSKIRTELARRLTRNNEIKETCLSDKRPVGFSCMREYFHWNEGTRKYISKNMAPEYLPRFIATNGTHMEHMTPSGKFLQGDDSTAVNLLTFTADTLDKFIAELEN